MSTPPSAGRTPGNNRRVRHPSRPSARRVRPAQEALITGFLTTLRGHGREGDGRVEAARRALDDRDG